MKKKTSEYSIIEITVLVTSGLFSFLFTSGDGVIVLQAGTLGDLIKTKTKAISENYFLAMQIHCKGSLHFCFVNKNWKCYERI